MVAIAGQRNGRGWKLVPCLVALFNELDRKFPGRSKASDGSIGDAAHSSRDSDHNPDASGDVLAGDVTDDKAKGCDADLLAEWLRVSQDPRVKYVICNGRMFSSYATSTRKAWQWVPYSGPNGHFSHTHISVLDTAEAKTDTRTWFPGPPPSERKDIDDMALLIKSDAPNEPEWWVTNGVHRRHVQTTAEADLLAAKGLVPSNKPEVWPAGAVAAIPFAK